MTPAWTNKIASRVSLQLLGKMSGPARYDLGHSILLGMQLGSLIPGYEVFSYDF